MTTDSEPGRRERNKQLKQARIFQAARELFDRRGYAAATTQEIADLADVASGTLFRYATTKAELLLMVYNEEYRAAIERGIHAAADESGAERRLRALLGPLLTASRTNSENTAVYQREVLFGDPDEQYRAAGLELSRQLQESIAAILLDDDPRVPPTTGSEVAARAISDILHLEIARSGLGRDSSEDLLGLVFAQIDLVVIGFRATLSATLSAT